MNFFELQEALRIVQKVDKAKYQDRLNREKQLQTHSQKIGAVNGYTIITSAHVKDARDYEQSARDAGMDKKEYLRIIDKFFKKVPNPENKIYNVFYRQNGKGKYNELIISVEDKKITVVTIIQHLQPTPDKYRIRKGQVQTIVEGMILVYIEEY